MDQSFEHLTDAQIENYGDRNTGAGPSGLDRSGDLAIESHLSACADCRARVLQFHRSRLGLMKEPSRPPAFHPDNLTGEKAEVGSGRKENAGAAASFPSDSPVRLDCPPSNAIRDLAAGLASPNEAETSRLLHHAAQCDRCGPLLKTFTEEFADDLSPEEQALVSQLNSAAPTWQKNLAERMAAAVAPQSVTSARSAAKTTLGNDAVAEPRSPNSPVLPPSAAQKQQMEADQTRAPLASKPETRVRSFRLPSLKWLLIPAAAPACAAIAFFIWNSQRQSPEKVEKLLAQAYTEQRTMEMRIPYAAHADFKQTRSGDTSSLLNSPQALRKATDIVASNLKKNSEDPQWLLLSARLDLIDWRYKSALSTLNKIDDEKLDSSDFRLTQSLALYEKAEIEHDPQSYGQVVDILGKSLRKTPDDPLALFNQAVACEKLFMYECATNDYEHFLKVEANSSWSAEAREHLNRIKEKKTPER